MTPAARPLDLRTLVALGALAFVVKCVVHEAIGHGGACLLIGGEPIALSSAWWSGDYPGVSLDARRFERAAGTLANLLVAASAAAALAATRRHARRAGHPLGTGAFFLWLVLVTNLLSGGGYLMVDPLFGFGDWTAVLDGLPHAAALRWVFVAAGLALSLLGLSLGRRWLTPWIGPGPGRRDRSRRLGLVPYLVGATLISLSALLNPLGLRYAFTSALSTFGGCAWLVWIAMKPVPAPPADLTGALPRAPGWWLAAALAALFVLGVLGPSVRFG